jgi:hypothetical protein
MKIFRPNSPLGIERWTGRLVGAARPLIKAAAQSLIYSLLWRWIVVGSRLTLWEYDGQPGVRRVKTFMSGFAHPWSRNLRG